MLTDKIAILLLTVTLMLTASGCDKDEHKKLAEMAERHSQSQAEQNQRTVELQREVAAGSRQLVEADAKARKELATLQRAVQAERSEIGRQRDILEQERRELSSERRLHPIIAAAITSTGLLLACLLPLLLCWPLLRRPIEPADDQAVAELLLDDLVAEQPLLLQSANQRAIGLDDWQTECPDDDVNRPDASD